MVEAVPSVSIDVRERQAEGAAESDAVQRYSFDVGRGFRRGPAEGSTPIDDAFAALPAILRTLLVTDGTVTKILEAHVWEPISVDQLFHSEVPSDVNVPELGISVGDGIIKRRVILRGRASDTVYVAAETLVATQRFSSQFRQILKGGEKGIGELIREHRLETFREISRVAHIEAGPWGADLLLAPDHPIWLRSYLIYHQEEASVMITEVFAEERFLGL